MLDIYSCRHPRELNLARILATLMSMISAICSSVRSADRPYTCRFVWWFGEVSRSVQVRSVSRTSLILPAKLFWRFYNKACDSTFHGDAALSQKYVQLLWCPCRTFCSRLCRSCLFPWCPLSHCKVVQTKRIVTQNSLLDLWKYYQQCFWFTYCIRNSRYDGGRFRICSMAMALLHGGWSNNCGFHCGFFHPPRLSRNQRHYLAYPCWTRTSKMEDAWRQRRRFISQT